MRSRITNPHPLKDTFRCPAPFPAPPPTSYKKYYARTNPYSARRSQQIDFETSLCISSECAPDTEQYSVQSLSHMLEPYAEVPSHSAGRTADAHPRLDADIKLGFLRQTADTNCRPQIPCKKNRGFRRNGTIPLEIDEYGQHSRRIIPFVIPVNP